MLVRHPSILLASYSSFISLPAAHGSSTSLPSGTRQRRRGLRGDGSYATLANSPSDHSEHHNEQHEQDRQAEHVWPKPAEGQKCPTPYQIFAMKHNATYSKARFYDLVKQYHPDLSNVTIEHQSHHLRMERYRLIVNAHSILSDPAKRKAYDRFGAGWNGRAEVGGRDTWRQPSPHHPPGPFSHSWNDQSDPIWSNATWEDWERFHARKADAENPDAKDSTPQSPVYLQNTYFVALVMLLAIAGGSANYNRAQDAGLYFVEQRDIVHDKSAKDLRRVRQEISTMSGRDERIQWFLRNREATTGTLAGNDVEALRDQKADRLLTERDICRSEDISEKDG